MRYLAGVTTLVYAEEKCTGCGRCVDVCPHGVFVMEEDHSTLTPARQENAPHPCPSPLEGEGKRERGLSSREGT